MDSIWFLFNRVGNNLEFSHTLHHHIKEVGEVVAGEDIQVGEGVAMTAGEDVAVIILTDSGFSSAAGV